MATRPNGTQQPTSGQHGFAWCHYCSLRLTRELVVAQGEVRQIRQSAQLRGNGPCEQFLKKGRQSVIHGFLTYLLLTRELVDVQVEGCQLRQSAQLRGNGPCEQF